MAVPANPLEGTAVDRKLCAKCGVELPLSEFVTVKSRNTYRLFSWCKPCKREYSKQLYHNQTEEKKAAAKETQKKYVEANREKVLASRKKWREENPERYAARKQEYYLRTRERDRERKAGYKARYVRENKERVNNTTQRRRARKKQNGVCVVTAKELQRIYSSPCLYCGSTTQISVDHVIPIYRGGRHSIGNLVPACKACNSSKGTKLITEWKKFKSSH